VEEENLNERETQLLENSSSRILEVIKRDERLEKIAKDIAHHFPRRGFLGKGMVVSVDKFTAVKMYDKVQHYWKEEIKAIIQERNEAQSEEDRNKLTALLNYMNQVEMAVVVSEEMGEMEKFQAQGLDFTQHRQKLNAISPEGKDIEDRFKDKDDKLQLVFVCAMWLTGFDVPSLSTLYLDKPMKGHTLMQAIARANRVFPDKTCGVVVDYVNVFKYMQQALSDYASNDDNTEFPAKDIEQLMNSIAEATEECDKFLREIGVNIDEIIKESDTFNRLEMLENAYMLILENDDNKNRFKVLSNTLVNLYEASKPEIIERHWYDEKFNAICYLNDLMNNRVNSEKLARAKERMVKVLDQSVSSADTQQNAEYNYAIYQGNVIDLSKLDLDAIRKELKQTPYKALEIESLRDYIEHALEQMINKNCTRIRFSERYKGIIDRYNAGGTENEEYYNKLLELVESMKQEQGRASEMDLEEEELEIFDLLIKDRKLTKAEEQKVKLAAKNLYKKLLEEKTKVMVVDWYKDEQPKQKVLDIIRISLNNDLPESYDREVFSTKTDLLMNHFIDMAVQGYGWIA
jgi:type I restriction enzyme R subunit